jgi:zinc transport system ATP-binding protein
VTEGEDSEGTSDGLDAILEIEGLTVRRRGEELLRDVAFQVRRGSIHVIVGPNGAGKSTLLSAILNQIPFEGRIDLFWTGSGAIGYVPQNLAVDPTLPVTVADFLALTRQRRPVCLGLTRRARSAASELLDHVGLRGLEDRPLAVLSGGELRRVLLAHALDPEPELLILDEPSAGLDEQAMRMLEETLRALRATGRVTVLMVSHDAEQVQRVADRVTVLDRSVVSEGSPEILASGRLGSLLPGLRDRQPARA